MKLITGIMICNLLSLTCTYFGILHLNIVFFFILLLFSIIVVIKFRQVCKEKEKLIIEHNELLELMNKISQERLAFLLNKQENLKSGN